MFIFKNHKLLLITLVFLLLVVICGLFIILGQNNAEQKYGKIKQNAIDVSVIHLIASSEKYDGKLIRIEGVSNIEYEGNALYISKDDYKNSITKNAIYLMPDYEKLKTTPNTLKKTNGNYVLIEGIFNSKNNGHFGLFSGTIENINRFEKLQ